MDKFRSIRRKHPEEPKPSNKTSSLKKFFSSKKIETQEGQAHPLAGDKSVSSRSLQPQGIKKAPAQYNFDLIKDHLATISKNMQTESVKEKGFTVLSEDSSFISYKDLLSGLQLVDKTQTDKIFTEVIRGLVAKGQNEKTQKICNKNLKLCFESLINREFAKLSTVDKQGASEQSSLRDKAIVVLATIDERNKPPTGMLTCLNKNKEFVSTPIYGEQPEGTVIFLDDDDMEIYVPFEEVDEYRSSNRKTNTPTTDPTTADDASVEKETDSKEAVYDSKTGLTYMSSIAVEEDSELSESDDLSVNEDSLRSNDSKNSSRTSDTTSQEE